MARPKRLGGIISTEWPARLKKFFKQYPRLTPKGVALVLTDIAEERGYKAISLHTLYRYCSIKAKRRPTDSFMVCWRIFEERVQKLEDEELGIRMSNGKCILVIIDGEAQTIWLPNRVFLHRCYDCRLAFIGQWNAKRCPNCR